METSRNFGVRLAPNFESMLDSIQTAEVAGAMLNWIQGGLSGLAFVLIYLGFLIVSRGSYARKLEALRPKGEGAVDIDQILKRIQKAVQGYVRIQTVTGLMIALASWLVMEWIGLPQPLFWAFLIFVASYVPVVGGAVAILAEFKGSRWLAVVLSADGNPYPMRTRAIVRRTKVPR